MTMYYTLQTHAMKAALAKNVQESLPLGFVEAMDRGTQTLEANLVQSFINVTENSETLLQASFNVQLRALSKSEDPSVASLAGSLLHALNSKSMPVSIQTETGEQVGPDAGEAYMQAAFQTLNSDLQAYVDSMQSQMPKEPAPAPVPAPAPANEDLEGTDAAPVAAPAQETETEEEK